MKKHKTKLKSKFTFDAKIAKRFSKTKYYKAQAKNMAMYDYIEKEKTRVSTPKWEVVTNLLEKYTQKGLAGFESSTAKILKGIYEKNKTAVLSKETVINTNLIQVIAKPEILLLAYRAIRVNKGALTKGGYQSESTLANFTEKQRKLYYNSKVFPDKFSLQDVFLACRLLRKGLYPWGTSYRTYVPKPGFKDKKRPITIPPFLDRVVQKAISMILEAIYEPYFESTNRSFGFRPNKSTHDAIIAATSNYSSGKVTAIEGDIAAAYDTVNKDKLIQILSEKIKDKKFLDLIRSRLNYDYIEQAGKDILRVRPEKGIPQGGIDSPYLFNIYMSKFDDYIHTDISNFLDTLNQNQYNKTKVNRPTSKHFGRIKALEEKAIRHQKKVKIQLQKASTPEEIEALKNTLYKKIKDRRLAQHRKLYARLSDVNRKNLKFLYIRYADDWLFLFNGNKQLAENIRLKIATFLRDYLELELSLDKTSITNITKTPAKFLGFQLKHPARGPIIRKQIAKKEGYANKKKFNLQRKSGTIVWASPDTQRLINRLHMKGFCDKNGKPKELPWLSALEAHVIIERYNAVIRGFAEFYLGFIRNNADTQRWIYILRFSCLKTLAQKYRTTIPGIFKRFGHLLTSKSLKTVQVICIIKFGEKEMQKEWTLWSYKALLKEIKHKVRKRKLANKFWDIEHHQNLGEYPLKQGKTASITNEDYVEKISWTSLRTQASFDMPCAACGTFENVQQHHIKHVRKTAYADIPKEKTYKQVMALRNRNQVPLCEDCHRIQVHSGKYNGQPLSSLVPSRLIDNRVLHIESFVKPGMEYHAKSLEEKGWVQVTKTTTKTNELLLQENDKDSLPLME